MGIALGLREGSGRSFHAKSLMETFFVELLESTLRVVRT